MTHDKSETGTRNRAIQTKYKGYRFRSRLEARYAVFFDALGIKWQYEKEGFELTRNLGPYLPDFWIWEDVPDRAEEGAWVEIKGELYGDLWVMSPEEKKLSELTEMTGFCSYLCIGAPDLEETRTAIFSSWDHGDVRWSRENTLFLVASNYMHYERGMDDLAVINAACDAAKSARFEYGETPRIR